jgi:putative transposase
LRRQLNAVKSEQFAWMGAVTKNAPQQAIKNLGAAFKRFFAGQGRYPTFKKKGIHDSFRADNGPDKAHANAVEIKERRLKLAVIGWVKMRETLRFKGKIISAVVSRTPDRWFVSLTVEVDHPISIGESQAVGGVDLGITRLASLNDGASFDGSKALRRNLGSANRRKAKAIMARLHARIAQIRQDGLHKLTTALVQRFTLIGIEDLNVRAMMANHRLARSIADMGFHAFRLP